MNVDSKLKGCLFCQNEKLKVVKESNLFYIIYDEFPVTKYHTLIIPKRHVKTYFDLNKEEILACDRYLRDMKQEIQQADPLVTSFNIGMNCGEESGQTIMHCHIHLIPRRKGDMKIPRGGVRGVIPGKQSY